MTGSHPSTEPPPRARIRAPSVVIVNTGTARASRQPPSGARCAVARGWRVCVVQFMKAGKWRVGEERSARSLGVERWAIGDGFSRDSKHMDQTEAIARDAWRTAREKLREPTYEHVILDEITYPMNWGWISTAEVVEAIKARPANVNVIATGRDDAPPELVDFADTVTEMRSRKHAFDRGVRAIRGIDF